MVFFWGVGWKFVAFLYNNLTSQSKLCIISYPSSLALLYGGPWFEHAQSFWSPAYLSIRPHWFDWLETLMKFFYLSLYTFIQCEQLWHTVTPAFSFICYDTKRSLITNMGEWIRQTCSLQRVLSQRRGYKKIAYNTLYIN